MINKRLLIKNLLGHNDENSFYDKKLKLSLGDKEGKAKFLKHICALSNSNPENNSYIVIGVEDEQNTIHGVDFFDDSKIQNLVNSYLINPPKIQYENVAFPGLPRHKVVGLVTILPNNKMTSLSKNAWKYKKGTIFFRRGSNSMTAHQGIFELKNTNKSEVEAIERNASNNIELTLNGVFDFINSHSEEYHPTYRVFHEQFVLCWAGKVKQINGKRFYSRVDIALINEQVRLFYSVLDDVQIQINASSFIITEYIYLGIDTDEKHFPLEKTIIHFKNNGKHEIVNEFLFEPPKYDPLILRHIYENNQSIVEKIEKNSPLSVTEHEDLSRLPTNYLICFLNGYKEAGDQLRKAKQHLKALPNKTAYIKYKHAMRVIRKVTYY